MPDTHATIEFLQDLPAYEVEKPYIYLPGADEDVDPDDPRANNLEFECHSSIDVCDMRTCHGLHFEKCGFQYIQHHASPVKTFSKPTDITDYQSETEDMLRHHFSAVKVLSYEVKLRKNQEFHRDQYDVNDKLLVEGPAKGAHNDVTISSGPKIIQRYLSPEDRGRYLRPGYRIRIVNTWRPLNRVLQDRPLALCDSRTVEAEDLVAADRILPDRVGEVYYLRYNPKQKWYWLPEQKCTEPFIFLMYDTMSGIGENVARLCPHVSFDNPLAPSDAEPRRSVETRSIVINQVP